MTAFCGLCLQFKAEHAVFHAPSQKPRQGERVTLHTACVECAMTCRRCPYCRQPADFPYQYPADRPYSIRFSAPERDTCAHSFLEQVDGRFQARFCLLAPGRNQQNERNAYCYRHSAPHVDDGDALVIAAWHGQEARVAQLLATPGIDVDRVDRYGNTALICAAAMGHEVVVAQLLSMTTKAAAAAAG